VTKRTDAGHGLKSKAANVANASSRSKKATRREDAAGEERRALLPNNEVSQATAELSGAIRRKSTDRGGHCVYDRARSRASREGMKRG